jgi:hypothetical protein
MVDNWEYGSEGLLDNLEQDHVQCNDVELNQHPISKDRI